MFALSIIEWCRENFVMISLTVQELLCWQTDRQTNTQIELLKTIPPGGNYNEHQSTDMSQSASMDIKNTNVHIGNAPLSNIVTHTNSESDSHTDTQTERQTSSLTSALTTPSAAVSCGTSKRTLYFSLPPYDVTCQTPVTTTRYHQVLINQFLLVSR